MSTNKNIEPSKIKQGTLTLKGTTNDGSSYVLLLTNSDDSSIITIDTVGNILIPLSTSKVGICTISPDKVLEINSSDGNNLRLTYNDSNGSAVNCTDFTLSASGDLSIKSPYNIRLGDYPNNYTNFDVSGHQTMINNAKPWRDELTDAINIKVSGTGVELNNIQNTVDFLTNTQMADDYLYCNIQLNHDKDLDCSIYPHIHFIQSQNAVPNFLLQYRWQIDGSTIVTTWTNLKCNTLTHTYTADTSIHQIAYSNPITPPLGSSLSDIVQFRICRDTDNDSSLFSGSDPYTIKVGVMAFDIHFMINSLGSTEQYVK